MAYIYIKWKKLDFWLYADVAGPALRTVFLAHMSSECNRPELALHTAREALKKKGFEQVEVKLTYSDRPSDLVRV